MGSVVRSEHNGGVCAAGEGCVKAFRDSLANDQLVLKNFSGEDKVHGVSTGTGVTLDVARWHTLSQLEVNSVKLDGQTLVMSCSRSVLIKDSAGQVQSFSPPTEIEIDVELGDSDPAEVLPKLKDALFYPTIDDALHALPKHLREVLPGRMNFKPGEKPDFTGPLCDCAMEDERACEAEHRKVDGIVPPKYLGGSDARFSKEARKRKISGDVYVTLTVDSAGQPQDVWIVKPVGMGLDEEAAKAVLTYKFRPAMCHDNPTAVDLFVDVRFRICSTVFRCRAELSH